MLISPKLWALEGHIQTYMIQQVLLSSQTVAPTNFICVSVCPSVPLLQHISCYKAIKALHVYKSTVCVSVCVCVCPAFMAYISVTVGRIFMKLICGSVDSAEIS